MSDEQTMPEVMTRKWYPTLATRMAGDSSVAAMVDCEQRYNQEAYVTYTDHLATIATLTAERDALVEAIDAFRHTDRSGRRDIVDLEQLDDAVEKCLSLINGDC